MGRKVIQYKEKSWPTGRKVIKGEKLTNGKKGHKRRKVDQWEGVQWKEVMVGLHVAIASYRRWRDKEIQIYMSPNQLQPCHRTCTQIRSLNPDPALKALGRGYLLAWSWWRRKNPLWAECFYGPSPNSTSQECSKIGWSQNFARQAFA